MNEPAKRNFYFAPKFWRASLESNSSMSSSNSEKKSYGRNPPSAIKLFINVIRGGGNDLLFAF